jgi:hypothetical protein
MSRATAAIAATLVLLACNDRPASQAEAQPDTPPSLAIFHGLPVMPGSRLAGGSGEAAEAYVDVPVSADSVARWYRSVLIERSWAIRGDATDRRGYVTLYGTSPEGRPLWIMIQPTGVSSARVSVVATRSDSAAAPPQP